MAWVKISVKEEMRERDEYFWNIYSEAAMTKEFIEEFSDKINWQTICLTKNLSEDFIREFQDKVDWKLVSIYQKLSEDFIREFQDKVDWTLCFLYQILSDKFVDEFKDKIDEVEEDEERCYNILVK